MAQIIIQPGPSSGEQLYAIWSSTVDDFTHLGLDQDEVIRHFASLAYEHARAGAVKVIAQLRNGEKPYYQFTMSWEEALAHIRNKRLDEDIEEQHRED